MFGIAVKDGYFWPGQLSDTAPWRNLEKGFAPPAKKGSVAQLYSALDFGSSGWGLESLRGHKAKASQKCEAFFVLEI